MVNNSRPLVSIVTPSFNQGQYLEETILSVLNQDYPNVEYIIIDGGSTDKSVEIIKKYEESLAWWISEPDKGQTDALIKGFNKAGGKYLTWICSDDILEPSMINLSVSFLENNADAVLSYGNRTRIDSKGNIIGFSKAYIYQHFFKFGLGLPQETVLFRKTSYDSVGGLNGNLNMVMDYDLWCKLNTVGNFLYIPAFLGRFRSHKTNKSTQFSDELIKGRFDGQLTSEFKITYKKYFNSNFSIQKKKIALLVCQIIRVAIFKFRKYKNVIEKVKEIQNF